MFKKHLVRLDHPCFGGRASMRQICFLLQICLWHSDYLIQLWNNYTQDHILSSVQKYQNSGKRKTIVWSVSILIILEKFQKIPKKWLNWKSFILNSQQVQQKLNRIELSWWVYQNLGQNARWNIFIFFCNWVLQHLFNSHPPVPYFLNLTQKFLQKTQ